MGAFRTLWVLGQRGKAMDLRGWKRRTGGYGSDPDGVSVLEPWLGYKRENRR